MSSGSVNENTQRIEPSIYQALHVVPGTPIRSLLERLDVLPKAHTDLGWIKQPVALLNAIAEGIYRRPGNFVDRNLRIRQRHRRLEDEQVVVTSVVHVDDS